MVLEFSVENYRSIKTRQVLSLVAESTKAKSNNVFEVQLPNGALRLLKTAVMYGPNASGKSNFIRAFSALVSLVRNRIPGVGESLHAYDPFRFSTDTMNKPVCFQLFFVFEGVKYEYAIAFDKNRIVEEELSFYPKGQKKGIFKRIGLAGELVHQIQLGKDFGNKKLDVFRNQSGLNKFGTDTPHRQLTKLYDYFGRYTVVGPQASISLSSPVDRSKLLLELKGRKMQDRLEKLIIAADTKISALIYPEMPTVTAFQEGEQPVYATSDDFVESGVSFGHTLYHNGKPDGYKDLKLEEESEGTRFLFWSGGLILQTLSSGGVLIIDELDNSLHPKLVKFLVNLFVDPKTNPENAQLIFATHEVTLLDRDLFRTDQIWFTEKNERGETELFSAQDFEGVREDVPFEKWYMAGKFGGLPNFSDIQSIFE